MPVNSFFDNRILWICYMFFLLQGKNNRLEAHRAGGDSGDIHSTDPAWDMMSKCRYSILN